MSVPRPPIQLVQTSLSNIQILGRDDPSIDITQAMQNYCQQRPPQLNSIHGYIFKSRSPSCGVHNVPLFNHQGIETGFTRGVFVSAILQFYPQLPITDELSLTSLQQLEDFLLKTQHYKNQL